MQELVRTNDVVLVSAVGALLDGAGIRHMVLDQNMSVIEGSLGVLPAVSRATIEVQPAVDAMTTQHRGQHQAL